MGQNTNAGATHRPCGSWGGCIIKVIRGLSLELTKAVLPVMQSITFTPSFTTWILIQTSVFNFHFHPGGIFSLKLLFILWFPSIFICFSSISFPKTSCNYDSRSGIKIAKSFHYHRFLEVSFLSWCSVGFLKKVNFPRI